MKEQILIVQKMQDYIKEHLSEEITLSALANVACYSPWHTYRLFREVMNMTPSDYIRKLRLSSSAIRLRDQKVKIIDEAYDCGFDVIELPSSKYLMFQGEPFDEAEYESAIEAIWQAEKKYDPTTIGYKWDTQNPRIQIEPIGHRGYIEFMPICK